MFTHTVNDTVDISVYQHNKLFVDRRYLNIYLHVNSKKKKKISQVHHDYLAEFFFFLFIFLSFSLIFIVKNFIQTSN